MVLVHLHRMGTTVDGGKVQQRQWHIMTIIKFELNGHTVSCVWVERLETMKIYFYYCWLRRRYALRASSFARSHPLYSRRRCDIQSGQRNVRDLINILHCIGKLLSRKMWKKRGTEPCAVYNGRSSVNAREGRNNINTEPFKDYSPCGWVCFLLHCGGVRCVNNNNNTEWGYFNSSRFPLRVYCFNPQLWALSVRMMVGWLVG